MSSTQKTFKKDYNEDYRNSSASRILSKTLPKFSNSSSKYSSNKDAKELQLYISDLEKDLAQVNGMISLENESTISIQNMLSQLSVDIVRKSMINDVRETGRKNCWILKANQKNWKKEEKLPN